MNFVLDMHIPATIAHDLRSDGHDAFHLRERGLQRLEDTEIVELAVAEHRFVVTFDLDFSAILAQSGAPWPSVIQFRLEKTQAVEILRWLREVISLYSAQLESGCILTVTPDRIRIRKLPLR